MNSDTAWTNLFNHLELVSEVGVLSQKKKIDWINMISINILFNESGLKSVEPAKSRCLLQNWSSFVGSLSEKLPILRSCNLTGGDCDLTLHSGRCLF